MFFFYICSGKFLPLIAIRIERLFLKKYASLLPLCISILLHLGFVSFFGSAARRPRSLSRFPPIAITARISQRRVHGLSCFPRHPDLLQLLCLVGQCYNCNLLIVEVIVNRMCFLLCCCYCCFCSSSSPSSPSIDPPHNTRSRSLLLFDCCSIAGLVAKAADNLTALK